ncbi:MAG: prolipoprotein diacylglyceryl transferase [Gelidibacter sp.]
MSWWHLVVFVRIGNFINSGKIVGKPTGSDFGGGIQAKREDFARHPAQLYEFFCYILYFILFYVYWKTKKSEQQGFLFGLFLVLLWTIRLFVEFIKEPQGDEYFTMMGLNTGQLLSIPFILIGLYFMFVYKPKTKLA